MTTKLIPFQPPIVILGNGQYPRHPAALDILSIAGTIICTDGSADKALENGIQPDIIIGDLDSTKINKKSFKGRVIHFPEQDNTDMAKTLEWCQTKGLKEISILAATGIREDHTLANLYLLAEFCENLSLQLITNYSIITCHLGKRTFQSVKGQLVSIIPLHPADKISTIGLRYPLTDETLKSSSQGISNLAQGSEFTVECTGKVWVFHSHRQE